MLQVHVDVSDSPSSATVDIQDGTFTLTFVGPTTTMSPKLQVDGSGNMSTPAPTQIGCYNQVICSFSGTSMFDPASANIAGQPLLISEMKLLSGAQIYTNPTTFTANQSMEMYVVFHGAPGLPAPSGYYGIRVGISFTKVIQLGSNGDSLVKLDPITNLGGSTQIQISYQGDPYYSSQVYSFPLTNPPIPNMSSGGSSGGGSASSGKLTSSASSSSAAKATATVGTKTASESTATAVTTVTADPSTTATPVTPVIAAASPFGSGAPAWIAVILGVLLLGGGA